MKLVSFVKMKPGGTHGKKDEATRSWWTQLAGSRVSSETSVFHHLPLIEGYWPLAVLPRPPLVEGHLSLAVSWSPPLTKRSRRSRPWVGRLRRRPSSDHRQHR